MNQFSSNARISGGGDHREALLAELERARLMDAGILAAAPNDFRLTRMSDLARLCLQADGQRIENGEAFSVITQAMRSLPSTGTSALQSILSNVANKALLAGWNAATEWWRDALRVSAVNDFRQATRAGANDLARLEKVPPRGEFKYAPRTDRTEYVTPATYGQLFGLSRAAILADDTEALTRIPFDVGRAADATVGDLVIDLLCSASGVGPTLNQDSTALFHTNHNNYTATSGAAPSVSTLEVARSKLRKQTDPGTGKPLNIPGRFLLVPSALETTAQVLARSLSSTAGDEPGDLQVIVDARLDAKTNGATAWYLLADGKLFDTLDVAFIGDAATPFLETRDGWSSDGIDYRVRIECGVAVTDYRGMYRNIGA